MQEEERVYKLMRDDNAEAYICKENGTLDQDQMNKNKIVFFFFQRGYNSRHAPFKIADFLSNDKAANALLDIIDKDRGSTTDQKALVRWEYWDKQLRRYLEYKRVKSFFKTDKRLVLMIRRQKKPNCFIHAVTSAVAYKAAMDSNNPSDAKTLDNNQIVRHVFNIDMLHSLLLGKGGNAGNLLRTLLKGTNAGAGSCVYYTRWLKEWCDLHGPVVLAGFEVGGEIKKCYGDKSIGKCNDGEMLQFDIDDESKESVVKSPLPDLPYTVGDLVSEILGWFHTTVAKATTTATSSWGWLLATVAKTTAATATTATTATTTTTAKGSRVVSDESLHLAHSDSSDVPDMACTSSGSDEELDEGVNEELDGDDMETHAMVVIGYRTDAVGKTWFLIQNTWHGMILFEASGDYLKSHMTRIGTLLAIFGEEQFLLPEKFTFLTENDAKISDGGFDGCHIADDYFDSMPNDSI
jgi:hypothetical protein